MKKILFIAFNYPYGNFGPSTNCTLRIMKKLSETGQYEVHCISYKNCGQTTYEIAPNVIIHEIPIKARSHRQTKIFIYLKHLFSLATYPYNNICWDKKHYYACKELLSNLHFDLVVSQYATEPCLTSAIRLKKNGDIDNKLMVIFWDAIYGKLPRRIIPKKFALHRQRKAEDEIARHVDKLISLYPLKAFHDEYGDVPNASGKRVYLGIPSIVKPKSLGDSAYKHVIQEGRINMLYSGTIFRSEYVRYLVELLNQTSFADRINLIFFSKGVDDDDFLRLKKNFKGNLQFSGWIPLYDLLALYPFIDFFVSFPGNPTAIRSKVFEYMSYGKPLILLYDEDNDVNVTTFARYPACISLDERINIIENLSSTNSFISEFYQKEVPFEKTEQLFIKDSPSAYIKLIDEFIS